MKLEIRENLHLELLTSEHADPILELVKTNRVFLREWMPAVARMKTFADFDEYIAGMNARFSAESDIPFVIVKNKQLVGRIGVYDIDRVNKIGAIGYWLGESFQKQGIVTEAVKVLLNYCFTFLDLNRIEIKCATNNFSSQAIPLKLGFTKEGIKREGELLHSEFTDLYTFSLLRKEWMPIG